MITPDFEKTNGLVPAVIQDYYSKNVLMLGYMNAEAFEKTNQEGKVTFYSRSKKGCGPKVKAQVITSC